MGGHQAAAAEREGSKHYLVLLISLSLLFVFSGAMLPWRNAFARAVIDITFAVIILTAVHVSSRRRRHRLIGLLLAAPALLTLLVNQLSNLTALMGMRHLVLLPILVFTSGIILANVMGRGKVTFDRICGSLCVFLLMGLIWSLLYSTLEMLVPGSFGGQIVGQLEDLGDPLAEGGLAGFTYFSFVTLTTLGYGDILPLNTPARTLAWMEAVAGQVYLTVLVARLVGLYISDERASGA